MAANLADIVQAWLMSEMPHLFFKAYEGHPSWLGWINCLLALLGLKLIEYAS